MFKCGIVLGGLAAATILGTFGAGPALASTGTLHRIPVVIHQAALTGSQSDPGAPGGLPVLGVVGQPVSGLASALAPPPAATVNGAPYAPAETGVVPGVGSAAGSLVSGIGLPGIGALIGGTSALQNPGGPLGGLGGLGALLKSLSGQSDLGKLLGALGGGLGGSNDLLDLGKLLSGQNGLPDPGQLLSSQNGLPDLGKLPSGANGQNGLSSLGNLLSGQSGSNSLGGLLNGSNGLGALSALGNLISGAKPAIGG